MEQLIPRSRIDEAARIFVKNEIASKVETFSAGVQFALNEIQPLMVEFANFCIGKDWKQNGYVYGKTTQQLLEEFIKERKKKDE